MARGLGATVVAIDAPFNPEGGAYVRAAGGQEHDHDHHNDHHDRDHGHSHDHDHDHSHGHDHNP
jgi:urease accessory protein